MPASTPPIPPAPVPAAKAGERCVSVAASGRLHFGFLDPAATLGRRFGSVGLMIDGPKTVVELAAAPSSGDALSAADAAGQAELARVASHLKALRARTGLAAPLAVHLAQVLPAHAGLGSGTQLALAVGRAFAQWHRLALPTTTLAHGLGRGLRSGIGIAGFDHGGLLLDAGPSSSGQPAPVLSRVALPAAWRVLLVLDPTRRGLSGEQERAALAQLAPLSQAQAAELCHAALMQVLAGAASSDFAAFAQGLSRMQQLLGDHFAPAQEGEPYTSPAVGRLMRWLAAEAPLRLGVPAGIGQSSWGPTAFAVLPSHDSAEALLGAARDAGMVDHTLQASVVAARQTGAQITDTDAPLEPAPVHRTSAESLWRWVPASAQVWTH